MTTHDCKLELERIDLEYRQAEKKLQEDYWRNKQRVMDQWAEKNSPYHIGDIVERNGVIIKIDRIRGNLIIYGKELYVSYSGPQLTKKLELRKDGSRACLFDNSSYKVKLIKVHKED